MIDVKIRWNTRCTDNRSYWRILIDGVESVCSNVLVEVPTYTTQDTVWDTLRGEEVHKHHISCKANKIIWKGDVVVVQ